MSESVEQRIQSLEQLLAAQPRSPLFAQLAGYYLDAGRSQDALALCDKGLANYPFYSTGHLIKGRALTALKMNAEARRELELVHSLLPSNEAVARLIAGLPTDDGELLTATEPAAPVEEVAPEPPLEAAAPEAPAEPVNPESNPDQWLSQFTDAAQQEGAVEGQVVEPQEQTAETFAPSDETTPVESPELTAPSEDAFGIAPPEETIQPTAELGPVNEPFEDFAQRIRTELGGQEETLSLDEYLSAGPMAETAPLAEQPQEEDPFAQLQQEPSSAPQEAPPPPEAAVVEDPFAQLTQQFAEPEAAAEPPVEEKNQIEEIAEKLKSATKITPIIDLSERTTTPPSESDTPSETGFVTPTLAEIYAKQGWFDDAIKAYKTLAVNKPLEREKFEKRIQELEEQKRQQETGG